MRNSLWFFCLPMDCLKSSNIKLLHIRLLVDLGLIRLFVIDHKLNEKLCEFGNVCVKVMGLYCCINIYVGCDHKSQWWQNFIFLSLSNQERIMLVVLVDSSNFFSPQAFGVLQVSCCPSCHNSLRPTITLNHLILQVHHCHFLFLQ